MALNKKKIYEILGTAQPKKVDKIKPDSGKAAFGRWRFMSLSYPAHNFLPKILEGDLLNLRRLHYLR